ncbi:MAG: hypothetical protein QOH01_916 [Verrucomicrobiota bacterium]|jgi:hypothetical protein
MRICAGILGIALFAGRVCAAQTSEQFVVSLERTACQTGCPEYRIAIFADGKVQFEGKAFVKAIGIREGRISQADIEKFLNQVCSSGFFDLKSRYVVRPVVTHSGDDWRVEQQSASEGSGVITEIAVGGLHHRVENYGPGPGWLKQIEEMIDRLARAEKWIR